MKYDSHLLSPIAHQLVIDYPSTAKKWEITVEPTLGDPPPPPLNKNRKLNF